MKQSYQKYLLASSIIAIVSGLFYLGFGLYLHFGVSPSGEFLKMIYTYLSFGTKQTISEGEMLRHIIRTFLLTGVVDLIVGIYQTYLSFLTPYQYEKKRKFFGGVLVVVVLFFGYSLLSIILWVIANIKFSSTKNVPASARGKNIKEQQLANAQEYAKKLKYLRDSGQISQEEFLAEITTLTECMTQLIEEIEEEKHHG